MADNILSGKVVITAPGVDATFAKVAGSVKQAETAIKKIPQTSSAATQSLINLGRVAQDAPFGFIGIANNLNPLLESFQRLKATSGSTGGALKALAKDLGGAGGLGFALSIASSLAIVFGDKLFGAGKAAKMAKEENDKFSESLKQISSEIAGEISKVSVLVAFIKSETTSRQERTNAIKELQRIAPAYFATLNAEKTTVAELTTAYGKFTQGIQNSVTARVFSKQLEEIIKTRLELEKLIKGNKEEVIINGKLVTVQNAFYGTKQDVQKIQDKINNAKIQELKISERIAALEPPKGTQGVLDNPNPVKTKVNKIVDLKPVLKDLKPFDLNLRFDQILFDEIRLGKDLKTFAERLQEYSNSEINKAVKPFKLNLSPQAIANNEAVAAMRKAGEILTASFAESLGTGLGDAISSVGEGIGNILSGKDFGTQIFQVLGTLIQNLGKALIQFAVIDKVVKSILANPLTIGPGLALAAGIAAIAAGALIKNIAGARAAGGPVSGGKTYLVGERGPELFTPNTGGQIIPNDRLGSGRGFASGGMAVRVTGEFLQRGKDLLAVITLADQSKARLQ